MNQIRLLSVLLDPKAPRGDTGGKCGQVNILSSVLGPETLSLLEKADVAIANPCCSSRYIGLPSKTPNLASCHDHMTLI